MTADSQHSKKVCVILGVGASCDVHDSGSVIEEIEWRPPLARELFDIEGHPRYREILNEYPGADHLTQQLAPLCKLEDFNLEAELRQLSQHNNAQTRQHFKQIPAYLRDLIWFSAKNYTARPSCYEQLVFRLLAEDPHEVLFLLLNYDDLLEQALNQFDDTLTFSSMSDYVEGGRQAKVVKLHGCVNWFILLNGGAASWHSLVRELDLANKPADGDVLVRRNLDIGTGKEFEGKALYPIITAPLAGKNPNDLVCPSGHLAAAQEFLETCNKFLMIGTSGLDDDLLDFLNRSLPVNKNNCPCFHVVGGPDAGKVVERFNKGVSALGNASLHELPTTFNNGFRDYLSSEAFRIFAGFER